MSAAAGSVPRCQRREAAEGRLGEGSSSGSINQEIIRRTWINSNQDGCSGMTRQGLRIVEINKIKLWAGFWSLANAQIDGLSLAKQLKIGNLQHEFQLSLLRHESWYDAHISLVSCSRDLTTNGLIWLQSSPASFCVPSPLASASALTRIHVLVSMRMPHFNQAAI